MQKNNIKMIIFLHFVMTNCKLISIFANRFLKVVNFYLKVNNDDTGH